ncbi:phenylacetate--CoA ligase family protein [Bacillus sp. FJAT-29814]|uniref:phenylacetate--CoA ligase family protein n=1 Tax=Bacillus sp. FJAT-29814 TaxID=1729688 RepID=UPI000835F719|nr:AMP-binding protein [Bacillus sp. FJAT-29814]
MIRTSYKKYWNEERETLDPKKRNGVILEKIKEQLDYVYNNLPFYRNHYDNHNFKPSDVKSLEDFTTKVPVITKKMLVEDQKQNPIFGSYAGNFAPEEIARLQGSSGTSGTPTFYRVSKSDWDRAAEVHAMALWSTGLRPSDVVQIGFPFSIFFGGWGVLQGAERIGSTVFPLGAIESDRHIDMIDKIKPTAFSATVSYCMHLLNKARERGVELSESSVKRLIAGGESGASLPNTRAILTKGWGASLHDAGSTSEMYPFMTSTTCDAEKGVHLYQDEVFTEIVSIEDSNIPISEGERGAVVYTHLWRKSQPMIRFWSGDESFMTEETCSCGRTYPRLPYGVLGRLDDMLVIRGTNVYPSSIENTVRSLKWSGAEYQIIVDKKGALDEMTVNIEYQNQYKDANLYYLKEEALELFKNKIGIRVAINLVEQGSMPETVFKAKRVIDNRKKLY